MLGAGERCCGVEHLLSICFLVLMADLTKSILSFGLELILVYGNVCRQYLCICLYMHLCDVHTGVYLTKQLFLANNILEGNSEGVPAS